MSDGIVIFNGLTRGQEMGIRCWEALTEGELSCSPSEEVCSPDHWIPPIQLATYLSQFVEDPWRPDWERLAREANALQNRASGFQSLEPTTQWSPNHFEILLAPQLLEAFVEGIIQESEMVPETEGEKFSRLRLHLEARQGQSHLAAQIVNRLAQEGEKGYAVLGKLLDKIDDPKTVQNILSSFSDPLEGAMVLVFAAGQYMERNNNSLIGDRFEKICAIDPNLATAESLISLFHFFNDTSIGLDVMPWQASKKVEIHRKILEEIKRFQNHPNRESAQRMFLQFLNSLEGVIWHNFPDGSGRNLEGLEIHFGDVGEGARKKREEEQKIPYITPVFNVGETELTQQEDHFLRALQGALKNWQNGNLHSLRQAVTQGPNAPFFGAEFESLVQEVQSKGPIEGWRRTIKIGNDTTVTFVYDLQNSLGETREIIYQRGKSP